MAKSLITPKGKAKYPHVTNPSTTFNPDGEYSCDLLVSEEVALEFKASIDEIYEAAYKEEKKTQKKPKLKRAPDSMYPIRQDEDGEWFIRGKQPAKKTARSGEVYEFGVKIFDTKGKPTEAKVGSGSILKMAVEPRPWFVAVHGFGITLALKAVQVIDLVEYGGGSSDFGFAEEDGSFESDSESLGDDLPTSDDPDDGDF